MSGDERILIAGPHECLLPVSWGLVQRALAQSRDLGWFKDLTGAWPKWGRPFAPGEHCDERIDKAIRKQIGKWIARQNAIKKAMAKKRDREEVA